jgi:type IV pilus assembly protein PilC
MKKIKKRKLHRKLSIAEQGRIARRLSTLLGAGISVIEAARLIHQPSSVFSVIVEDISKGRMCSEAFQETGAFDQSLVEMIRIGEQSGTLGQAFARAAAFLESRDNLSKKITGAMVYPAFIACATLGIAIFLVVFIFPKIIPLITGMNIPLPFLTRALMIVSDVLTRYWMMIAVGAFVGALAAKVLWKYSAFVRRFFRRILLFVPIIGTIYRGRMMVEIFRPLGLLLDHGELVPKALVSVGKSLRNRNEEYSGAIFFAARAVVDGENMTIALRRSQSHIRSYTIFYFLSPVLFPSIVIEFLEIGERTGSVAGSCGHIATIYEAEVDESIKRITQIIEPVLMLGMGLTVGAIALSIVMPIYSITSHLTQ